MARRNALKGYWTCQRTTRGVRCTTLNPNRLRLCARCGKKRAAKRKPAHMAALDLSYEQYVALNGSETCGICGRPPSANRKLDRDHDHKGGGVARGLLDSRCNRALVGWMTPEWLRAAANYLEKGLPK